MSELSVNLNAATHGDVDSGESTTLSTPTESALMQRIADGDELALVRLLDLHGQMLARLIGRITAWHSDSDDILQEVLLIVWRKAATYGGQGSLEGWLKRIAVNRCRNHFRTLNSAKRKIENFALLLCQRGSTLSAYNVDQPDTVYQNIELQEALKKLQQTDRTLLVLYYLEEMSGSDVAEIMGLTLETFHVRLHRTRAKLRKVLEGEQNND